MPRAPQGPLRGTAEGDRIRADPRQQEGHGQMLTLFDGKRFAQSVRLRQLAADHERKQQDRLNTP